MDDYTISYLGVGRDILRCKMEINRTGDAPIIIADPDFDLTREEVLLKSNHEPRKELLDILDGEILSRASGTKFLGESVAKKLKGARLYMGAEALETCLTDGSCPQVILIATHGLFLPNAPPEPFKIKYQQFSTERFQRSNIKNPMMRSALALAGANTWLSGKALPPGMGKGLLFAQDIAALDLWGNELTVLSACDTARGEIKIGEGVFGLRRAFAIAGTKTLIMSLWKVPDRVTALLMEEFFNNFDIGIEPMTALQDAQNYIRRITVKELSQSVLGMEVLRELFHISDLSADNIHSYLVDFATDTPLIHPLYWGAWICQGG
jgi:CHAT domain-containing protein